MSFTDVATNPRFGVVSTTNATVQTKDDAIVEGTESFICALRLTVSPNNPLRSADPDIITVSIVDNDSECEGLSAYAGGTNALCGWKEI